MGDDKIVGAVGQPQEPAPVEQPPEEQVDPFRMKLKLPIDLVVGERSLLASALAPPPGMPPGAQQVQIKIKQLHITSAGEMGDFLQKVRTQEYLFPASHIPPLTIQILTHLINFIGYDIADEPIGDTEGETNGEAGEAEEAAADVPVGGVREVRDDGGCEAGVPSNERGGCEGADEGESRDPG